MLAHRALVCGGAHPALAAALAQQLGWPLVPREITHFADGETRVQLLADVRGHVLCLVQPLAGPVNDNLIALALLADAARAAGAVRVAALVTYLGYSRQEQRKRPGDPRSAQVVAGLLANVGIDELIAVDLHAPALESAFAMPLSHILPDSVLLPSLQRWQLAQPVVVSPDAGGLKRAQRIAAALGAPVAAVAKSRIGPDQAQVLQVLGDVRGRCCLVVDDMASTGRTLAEVARALDQAGAAEIHAAFTHPVLAPGAMDSILAAPFGRLLTTDTLPPPTHERLEVAAVAPALAQLLRSL